MNKLKELRSRYGLKQKDVAEKLGTTQQTIARWETGQTAIPVAQLKDLAALFSCSVDELLGFELHPTERTGAAFGRADHQRPFGTLRVGFGFGSRAYPIDEQQRDYVVEKLRPGFDLDGHKGWLQFGTLDNRLVFLNPAYLADVALVSDDKEQMPYWASPQTYQNLTRGVPVRQLGPIVIEEREQVIRSLFDKDGNDEVTSEEEERAEMAMNQATVFYPDGRTSAHFLTDETTTDFNNLSMNVDDVGRNAFIAVGEEGSDLHFINLSAVAAIEVPLEKYLEYLDHD
jgi:transcriptional regulator with XRE-family HTH domain